MAVQKDCETVIDLTHSPVRYVLIKLKLSVISAIILLALLTVKLIVH